MKTFYMQYQYQKEGTKVGSDEINFILSVLNEDIEKVSNIDIKKLNFPTIISFASSHKILGYLYIIFEKLNICPDIHNKWLEIFKYYYQGTNTKNKIFENEYHLNFQSLTGLKGIKGIYLITDIYTFKGQRPLNDIDLLLTEDIDNIDSLTKIIESKGYVQGYVSNGHIIKYSREEIIFKFMTHNTICPFVKIIGENTIKVDVTMYLKGNINFNNPKDAKYVQIMILISEIYSNQTNLHSIMYLKDIELIKYIDLHLLFSNFTVNEYNELLLLIEKSIDILEAKTIFSCYLNIFNNETLQKTIEFYFKERDSEISEIVMFGQEKIFTWDIDFIERCFDLNRNRYVSIKNLEKLNSYEQSFEYFKEREFKEDE